MPLFRRRRVRDRRYQFYKASKEERAADDRELEEHMRQFEAKFRAQHPDMPEKQIQVYLLHERQTFMDGQTRFSKETQERLRQTNEEAGAGRDRLQQMRDEAQTNAVRGEIEGMLSDREAQQALADMQRYGPDRPYWKRGELAASRWPVAEGLSPEEAATARHNIASILSVPDDQLSDELKGELVELAADGEDVYAYPPVSSPDRGEPDWNLWLDGRRIPAREYRGGGR